MEKPKEEIEEGKLKFYVENLNPNREIPKEEARANKVGPRNRGNTKKTRF